MMMTMKMNLMFDVNVGHTSIIMMKCAEPYKKYTIWAKAFTSKHEGNSSATLTVLTDVAGPGRSPSS